MKRFNLISLGAVVLVLGMIAGCALFAPVPATADAAATQQAQQITTAIQAANSILAEIKATKAATVTPAVPAAPVTVTVPTVTNSPATAPSVAPVTPAAVTVTSPASDASVDKVTQALGLLTTATTQLNAQLQSAPNVQAQQQAALNVGVQTAQAAAVTFGGPYGGLIAAGIGIAAMLIQSLVHSKSTTAAVAGAHQSTQAAIAMAGSMRAAIDGPGNVSLSPK